MKVVVIADVHGRDKWKEQIKEPADHYIFLGDYFDSFEVDGSVQIENFKEIVEFKRDNPYKVTLLSGNHDHGSYCAPDYAGACSGFQNDRAYEIRNILEPLRESGEIQACKIIENYIFVHAGLTETWCENYGIGYEYLEEQINDLFTKNLMPFIFQESKKLSDKPLSGYGDNIWQSPMWVRPYSLELDKIPNYIQVVGHTGVKEPTFEKNVWYTDCQGSSDKFLILEIE